jgi:hypothetical protein
MQERLSRTIVDALEVTLAPAEARQIAQRLTHDPRAYDLYLRARQEIWRFSAEGLGRAIRMAQAGLEQFGESTCSIAF